jgi:hypothetical protein
MYWLIEDKEKINILSTIKLKEVYVEIIPFSPTIHPVENSVSAVYIKPVDGSKGYMVTIHHSEAFRVGVELVQELLYTIEKIYVIDKKEFLHYFFHPNIVSLTLLHSKFEKETTSTHSFFYHKHPEQKNINTIVPIVKHYEVCEKHFETLKEHFDKQPNKFYNDKATIIFNAIERNGIKVNIPLFEEYFTKNNGGYVYTQYNLSTTTTRPSNKFRGINFAALNKDNGERECFIPRNDFFIEMDISAYHPTLLSNLLGYNFNTDDIHQSFANMYNVEYSKAKEITFKQMYGGIWNEYKDLPFFSKAQSYIDDLWDTFNYQGYIECPISKHIYKRDQLEDMNPQKLLNYVLQNLETANNVLILWDILKILRGKNTKLVLYVYDSFLFDVDKNEKDILREILDIFNKYKLQVKFKKGNTYNFN